MAEEGKQSFVEHLSEFRRRLIICIIAVAVTSIMAYSFSSSVLAFLLAPTKEFLKHLIFLKPTEAFFVTLKVSVLTGVVVASPVVLYQFWAFIAPGLQREEKKLFLPLIFFSPLLFLLGVCLAFKVAFPLGLKFLLQFQTPSLQPLFSISNYISFITFFVLGFGLVFELPVVTMVLTKLGLVSPRLLRTKRKHAVVILFILAALVTPPDVITQILLVIPLLILYEVSIWVSRIVSRSREVRNEKSN